jgi:ubiquinone/menaquinone biosynthesis C-methylase UbiE
MQSGKTFDPSVFERLKKAEENHFWFQIRRQWIFDKISKIIAPPAKVLEIGCGTGNVSSFLARKGYVVTGCELYSEAINMAWSGFLKVQGDAQSLPFTHESFDIVCLFDMIEHFQDDVTPLKEAVKVLKKEGILVLTVPAREELWSYDDDKAYHKRRYTKAMVETALSRSGVTPLLLEYMFMSLYLPVKYIRGTSEQNSDKLIINSFVNTLFKGIFHIERIVSKRLPLPIGTSLIAVAQKNT